MAETDQEPTQEDGTVEGISMPDASDSPSPSPADIESNIRRIATNLATVDRKLHHDRPLKLAACFNERSHFFSPFAEVSARFEPSPRSLLSLGLGTPSYHLTLRDQSKGLMMVIDPENDRAPLHLVPYTDPQPLSEADQKAMPAELARFNAASQDAPHLDLAFDKDPETQKIFLQTIQTAIETKTRHENNEKNLDIVRGSVGALESVDSIRSGLKGILGTAGGDLVGQSLKSVSGVLNVVDALRFLAQGRVAQTVVSLSGSLPVLGTFIQEGVAAGAEKMGFDVDPSPLRSALHSLGDVAAIAEKDANVCGSPTLAQEKIDLKRLETSIDPTVEKQPAGLAQNNLSQKPQAPAP